MMELGHFEFGFGIDIGLKSLESILFKQSFFFFFSPIMDVQNISVKHTEKLNGGEIRQIL